MLKQLCGNKRQMVMHVEMVLIVSGEAPGKSPSHPNYFFVRGFFLAEYRSLCDCDPVLGACKRSPSCHTMTI